MFPALPLFSIMTKTEIANIALAKFREGRITNIESTTDPVAVVMNDQYDHALELVLEEHRWNFAGKRVALTRLSDAPPFGWKYQYQLPSDIVRLKDVNGEDVEASSRMFAIEGSALLTNDESVTITYIAKITDTNLFSPSFVEALCFKLASMTCARLTGDTELAIMLDKQYNYALSKASHNDTKAAGSRDRNLMQRLMDSAPILGGTYRYPSSSSGAAGGSGSPSAILITASQVSDFDTEVSNNPSVVANTAKVTNATHTGDVTGSTALTLDKTAISGKTLVTPESGDHILVGDASDGSNLKKVTAQSIADLAAASSGDMQKSVYDPTLVAGDAFDMDNMVEGATNKILTSAERTNIADNVDYLPRVLSTTSKTATFTAAIGETHFVDTSGGGFTANLPAIAGGQGRIAFYFTGTGNNLTVDPSGAEKIGGKNSIKLSHGHNTIENDGTEWKLIQRSGISPNRLDPAQITANQDGYNPADWGHGVTHLYIDSDASREIQGFEEDGFIDMDQVVVTNDGSNDIVIKHDTSTALGNRVIVDGGLDFTLKANQSGILMRDGGLNRWRFYGINQDLTSYQLKPAEGAFVDGDKTKLDGIEAGADVTDTANVTAAGALMDSEVDADIKTLSLPANTTITAFGASLVDDADAATARATLGIEAWYITKMGSEAADTSGTGEKTAWVAPAAGKIHAVHSGCSTVTAGASLTVDVQKNATTILSTKGVIATADDSTTTGTAHVLTATPTSFAAGDRISFHVDTFGGTGAKGLHTDLLISWD